MSMVCLEVFTGRSVLLYRLFKDQIQAIVQTLAYKHINNSQFAHAYDDAEIGGLFAFMSLVNTLLPRNSYSQ